MERFTYCKFDGTKLSILRDEDERIDGKEEARKALEKVHGKTKKQVTTDNNLTLMLEEGTIIEWKENNLIIKGPFLCKVINKDTIQIEPIYLKEEEDYEQ